MSSIPALIWPETLDAAPIAARNGDALTIRAAATMALSKTASNRRWNLIAVDLGLPARLANPIRRYWRTLSSDPTAWYDYLSWINDLFVLLHHHRPPINYQTRRATAASQPMVLSCARAALQNPHRPQPTGLGPISLARAFWPTFTESDPQLAPAWVAAPDRKAALRVRTLQAGPAALRPWLEAVQDRLAAGGSEAADGPLTWQPP